MKIHREGFLAAVLAISAANAAVGCKAKYGDDATPENNPSAESAASPVGESGQTTPANNKPLPAPNAEGGNRLNPLPIKPLLHPADETAPGWGSPPATAAPAPVYYGPPAPVLAWRPPCPGPGCSWVSGYWYPVGRRHVWRAGYWAPRPYPRIYRVAPRYYGPRYTRGHWRR